MVASKEVNKVCPKCGSGRLMKFGTKWAGKGDDRHIEQQYQCKNCGKVSLEHQLKEVGCV